MNRPRQPVICSLSCYFAGAPGRIRTRDPLLRRQLLCPAELRALERNCAWPRSHDGYMKVAVCRTAKPPPLGQQAVDPEDSPTAKAYPNPPSLVEFVEPGQLRHRITGSQIDHLRVEVASSVTREPRTAHVTSLHRNHPRTRNRGPQRPRASRPRIPSQ